MTTSHRFAYSDRSESKAERLQAPLDIDEKEHNG